MTVQTVFRATLVLAFFVLLSACKPATIQLPNSLAGASDNYVVDYDENFFSADEVSFGTRGTPKVNVGWSHNGSFGFEGGLNYDSGQDWGLTVANEGKATHRLECQTSQSFSEQSIAFVLVHEAHEALVCAIHDVKSGKQTGQLAMAKENARWTGDVQIGEQSFSIDALHRLEGARFDEIKEVGYAIGGVDAPLAHVHVGTTRKRVVMSHALDAEGRTTVAVASATLLLFTGIEEENEEDEEDEDEEDEFVIERQR